MCILNTLAKDVRFNMGECRNDYGGYFIINGKEKVIIPQETFANNMIYVKKNSKLDIYSYSAEIRSVSEDASKPIRKMMFAGFKKELNRRLRKGSITPSEYDTELNKAKLLYSKGRYPAYKDKTDEEIKKMYQEVKLNE
jgi:DNA-directed RNA polymerase beta subunit